MSSSRIAPSLVLTVLLASVAPAVAQDMPQPPTPGPEHQILKADEGTWAATIEMLIPGMPPSSSTGLETNRMGCGGLCLITDFKGEIMGMTFEGHGSTVWDPTKKKYIGSWSDSMAPGLSATEATYDASTKTLSATTRGLDMMGNPTTSRSTVVYKEGSRVMSLYSRGPDGNEALTMRITYAKKP